MPKKTTRNASGSGSIRQRPDGTWEARYTVGRDPGTGRQVQKSVYGKTQKEVRQKLTAATHQIDEGIYIEPSRITVVLSFLRLHPSTALWALLLTMMATPFLLRDSCPQ